MTHRERMEAGAEEWRALVSRMTARYRVPIDLSVQVCYGADGRGQLALVVGITCLNKLTGAIGTLLSPLEVPLMQHCQPKEALWYVRQALVVALVHELDECLLLDGVQLNDPHLSDPPPPRLAWIG